MKRRRRLRYFGTGMILITIVGNMLINVADLNSGRRAVALGLSAAMVAVGCVLIGRKQKD